MSDKKWKPVPQVIREFLTEEEQQYLRDTFPQYQFQFPKDGHGKTRAHCLSAISRNMLEKQIVFTKKNKLVVDFGGAFHRHYYEGRTNIYTVMFRGNIEDQRRTRERIDGMIAHDKETAQAYLDQYVCFVDNNNERAFPKIQFDCGIMIHALYNNSPADVAQLMALYRINTLDCTINRYEEDLEMYCRTLKWNRDDDGLYFQTDIQAGTSVYTHTQAPNLYENIKQIRTDKSIILVATNERCGDQLIIGFERFDASKVTSGFDDKMAVVRRDTVEHITYPTFSHAMFGYSVDAHITIAFHPNRLALNRCIEILALKHPGNNNVYQYAFEEISSLNHKTLLVNGNITFKIQLSPDEMIQHALYATHKHVAYNASLSRYTAVPRSTVPWHQLSLFQQIKTVVTAKIQRWTTFDPVENFNNSAHASSLLPYFSTSVSRVSKTVINATVDAGHEDSQPIKSMKPLTAPVTMSLKPSHVTRCKPKINCLPFAIAARQTNQMQCIRLILAERTAQLKEERQIVIQNRAASVITRAIWAYRILRTVRTTARNSENRAITMARDVQSRMTDIPVTARPTVFQVLSWITSPDEAIQPALVSNDQWILIMFAARRHNMDLALPDDDQFHRNVQSQMQQFSAFLGTGYTLLD